MMEYKKSAKGRPFQPVQAIDYTRGLDQEEARQRASRQLNETIAGENQQVIQNNLRNIDTRFTDNLTALAGFSETLAETLYENQKEVNKREEAAGLNEAFMDAMNGVSDPNAAQFEAGEAALRETDALIDETAIQIQQQGAGYGPANKLRQMSGWRAYGYAQGMAQLAGGEYGAYLEQQMMRDDITLTDPTGASFTPQTAIGSQRLQAISQFREAYIAERGLATLNHSLVNKYAFPRMIQSESEFNNAANRREAQAARDNAELEAKTIFDRDLDFNGLVRRLAASNGGNYKDALDTAFQHLQDAIRGDVVNDLDAIKGQLDPRTGKSIGWLMRTRFGQLEADLATTNLNEWRTAQAQSQQAFDEAEKGMLSLAMQDPTAINPEELEAMQSRLQELHPNGRRSSTLDTLIQQYGNSAAQRNAQREKLQRLAATGTLTPQDVLETHISLWNEFMPYAEKIAKANAESAPKEDLKAIEGEVRKITNQKNPDLPLNIESRFVVSRLQNLYLKERAKQLASGTVSAEQAGLNALAIVQNTLNTSPEYKWDSSRGFGRITSEINRSTIKGREAFNQRVENAEALRSTIGIGFLDSPEVLLSEAELIEMEANFNTPYWQPPAIVKYYAEALNKNPLEIINRQREAVNLNPLEPQAYVEEKGLDPDVQQLLRQYPTQTRTERAWGQSGKFNEAIVPLQLGPMISQYSAQYGVDPAVVAGIIEAENAGPVWRSDLVSPAGALGLAQIMPGTARDMGVDPTTTEGAIEGAAKYVRYIMDQHPGVTPEMIAMMYNAGPFRDYYPYGQENTDYRTKFLRGFSKYGGGQGYWSSPMSMRQTFAEQQP